MRFAILSIVKIFSFLLVFNSNINLHAKDETQNQSTSRLMQALHPDVDMIICEKEIKSIYSDKIKPIQAQGKTSKDTAYTDQVHQTYLMLKEQAGDEYADLYVYKVLSSSSQKKYMKLAGVLAAFVMTTIGAAVLAKTNYLGQNIVSKLILKIALPGVLVPTFVANALMFSTRSKQSFYEKAYLKLNQKHLSR